MRWLRALGGAVAGGGVGASLGLVWFARYGSDEFLGGAAAALAGIVVGSLAGGSWGWCWPEWRRVSPPARVVSVVAWLACGAILLVGIVYVGGWTDSDGPNGEAMAGLLGIPGGLLGVWIVARSLRGLSVSRLFR